MGNTYKTFIQDVKVELKRLGVKEESIKPECPLCHGYCVVGIGQHPDGGFADFAPCPRGCKNGLEE